MTIQPTPKSVVVVGAGAVGSKRAAIAATDPRVTAMTVVDIDPERATRVASALRGIDVNTAAAPTPSEWPAWLERRCPDFVVVSTTNRHLAPIGIAALEAGAHVLIEKPMGRNAEEAAALSTAAERNGRVLHVGFTLRGHPAIESCLELVRAGRLGRLLFARCIYGHGGRPGYDQEWRGDPNEAGGGELLDQGVHVVDLIHAVFGSPDHVEGARLQTGVWDIAPLEDNAFAVLGWDDGRTATLHTSWTQWRNRFEFEVFGELGSISVRGLGGEGSSYGVESIVHERRDPSQPGAPSAERREFGDRDRSFEIDWQRFVAATEGAHHSLAATTAESLAVMQTIDAIYAKAGRKSASASS